MKIAVLLTCHNRKTKTVRCLESLGEALSIYNNKHKEIHTLHLEVFLTDDGCTDGTSDAAQSAFIDFGPIHVLHGNGNLYWAGGMRFCWREALKRHNEWDFYLLLNDDVEVMPNLFWELLSTNDYNKKTFGKEGLCSGNTCWRDNPQKRSYGGRVWVSRFWATHKPLEPTGVPQPCDLVNANILLVPQIVVNKIGIFYDGYLHGNADYDYGLMAKKAGYPVVVTANFCGIADNDHCDDTVFAKKVIGMSLKERKEWFHNPLRSSHDYFCFVRRFSPLRLPMVWLGEVWRLYFPKSYYRQKGLI